MTVGFRIHRAATGASACGGTVAGLASADGGALWRVRDASFGWATPRGGELRR
jgi:hypothetical protein